MFKQFGRFGLFLAIAILIAPTIQTKSSKVPAVKAALTKYQHSKSTKPKLVAWDIHGVLCTEPGFGRKGYKCKVKPEVFNIVKDLHQLGVPQTIWSNISCKSWKRLQGKQDFSMNSKYFDLNIAVTKGKYRKPAGECYQTGINRARSRYNVSPREILFFDNKPSNVKGARAMQIIGNIYCNPTQVRQVLKNQGLL